MYTKSVWKLFEILRFWNPRQDAPLIRSLLFYLSAHSPSDGHHRFKEIQQRFDDVPFKGLDGPEKMTPLPTFHDPAHGWRGGLFSVNRSPGRKKRVMGPAKGLRFDYRVRVARQTDLPRVCAIQSFTLTRQYYRTFSVERGLKVILKALPNVRKIRFEPWHGFCSSHQQVLED
ncbi:hypothetical protein F5B21DRAFT_494304 [Xylaria acuta]|nr:hypothetical protein F5B21DRAFT_494304 [Xylaria acuta]